MRRSGLLGVVFAGFVVACGGSGADVASGWQCHDVVIDHGHKTVCDASALGGGSGGESSYQCVPDVGGTGGGTGGGGVTIKDIGSVSGGSSGTTSDGSGTTTGGATGTATGGATGTATGGSSSSTGSSSSSSGPTCPPGTTLVPSGSGSSGSGATGSNSGSSNGSNSGSNSGSSNGSSSGSANGSDNGSDNGSSNGSDNGSNSGSSNGSNNGSSGGGTSGSPGVGGANGGSSGGDWQCTSQDGQVVCTSSPSCDSGYHASTCGTCVADGCNGCDCGGSNGGTSGGSSGGSSGSAGPGGSNGALGCTLTQGYWKNHAAWPVASLTLGGQTYSEAQLMTILGTAPGGDASLILAHQLIATLLNAASGASQAPVGAVVQQAQAWLSANSGGQPLPYGVSSSSAAGADAVSLANQLDAYNNGQSGVPHCN